MHARFQKTENGHRVKRTHVSQIIHELIHQQWPELTNEEINMHRTDMKRFFEVVRQQYSVSQNEIGIKLNRITHEALYAAA